MAWSRCFDPRITPVGGGTMPAALVALPFGATTIVTEIECNSDDDYESVCDDNCQSWFAINSPREAATPAIQCSRANRNACAPREDSSAK